MTDKYTQSLLRIGIILLCIVTFTIVGTFAPAVYALYAPGDSFIEVHSFNVSDTSTSAETHKMCFDRTVHKQTTGTVFVEMYLVSDRGNKTEIYSESKERFFQKGRTKVQEDVVLPDSVEVGEYQYVRVYRMQLAKGFVKREFVFHSNKFFIAEDGSKNETLCK